MTIDLKKIMKTKFKERTRDIEVPLLDFFDDQEKAVWTVRGLTGSELAAINSAVDVAKNFSAIAEGIAAGGPKELASSIKELVGISDNVPHELVRRIEMLLLGSVSPRVNRQEIVRLEGAFPTVFFDLTNAILELTGEGKTWGKQKGSGRIRESEPLSSSATSEGGSSTNAEKISSPRGS